MQWNIRDQSQHNTTIRANASPFSEITRGRLHMSWGLIFANASDVTRLALLWSRDPRLSQPASIPLFALHTAIHWIFVRSCKTL